MMVVGNNQWFCVKVQMGKADNGEYMLHFKHPTQAGQQTGEWMTKSAEKIDTSGFGRFLGVISESKSSHAGFSAEFEYTKPSL